MRKNINIVLLAMMLLSGAAYADDFIITPESISLNASHGSSQTASFSVHKTANQSINFDSQIIGLPFNTSVFLTSASDELQNYSLSVSVPSFFSPGNYSGKIKLQHAQTVKYVDVSVIVPQNQNISIVSNMTFNISSGSVGSLVFPIQNYGNTLVELNGSTTFLHGSSHAHFFLPAGNAGNYSMKYSVPLNYTGSSNETLMLSNGMNVSFFVNAVDDTAPTIVYTEIEEAKATKPFDVRAVVIDNINVSNVWANDIPLTFDGLAWHGNITIPQIGSGNINITAFDGRNNVTVSKAVNVLFLEGFSEIPGRLPQVKKAKNTELVVLNVSEEFTFTVELVSAKVTPLNGTNQTDATAFKLFLRSPLNEEKELKGGPQTFKGIGQYTFVTLAENEGDYEYTLRYTLPDYVSASTTHERTFRQVVSTYDIIPNETKVQNMGSYLINKTCWTVDTGSREKNTRSCLEEGHPGDLPLSEMNQLVSQSTLNQTEENHRQEVARLERKVEARGTWLWTIFWILVISAVIGLIWWKWEELRFRMGFR